MNCFRFAPLAALLCVALVSSGCGGTPTGHGDSGGRAQSIYVFTTALSLERVDSNGQMTTIPCDQLPTLSVLDMVATKAGNRLVFAYDDPATHNRVLAWLSTSGGTLHPFYQYPSSIPTTKLALTGNGKNVFFIERTNSSQCGIFEVGIDGKNLHAVTNDVDPDGNMAWSDILNALFYVVVSNDEHHIWTWSPDGNFATQVNDDLATDPSVSPDGNSMLYAHDLGQPTVNEIKAYDFIQQTTGTIAPASSGSEGFYSKPMAVSSGTMLAFLRDYPVDSIVSSQVHVTDQAGQTATVFPQALGGVYLMAVPGAR